MKSTSAMPTSGSRPAVGRYSTASSSGMVVDRERPRDAGDGQRRPAAGDRLDGEARPWAERRRSRATARWAASRTGSRRRRPGRGSGRSARAPRRRPTATTACSAVAEQTLPSMPVDHGGPRPMPRPYFLLGWRRSLLRRGGRSAQRRASTAGCSRAGARRAACSSGTYLLTNQWQPAGCQGSSGCAHAHSGALGVSAKYCGGTWSKPDHQHDS